MIQVSMKSLGGQSRLHAVPLSVGIQGYHASDRNTLVGWLVDYRMGFNDERRRFEEKGLLDTVECRYPSYLRGSNSRSGFDNVTTYHNGLK